MSDRIVPAASILVAIILAADGVDADGKVHGLVLDRALVADLQPQRIELGFQCPDFRAKAVLWQYGKSVVSG